MEFPQRKRIRLTDFDYARSNAFFVTTCTRKNQHLFGVIVKWFTTQTTNAYIRGVRDGVFPAFDQHVWQGNDYEHVIRDREDFETRRKYMYENPLRWKYKYWVKP